MALLIVFIFFHLLFGTHSASWQPQHCRVQRSSSLPSWVFTPAFLGPSKIVLLWILLLMTLRGGYRVISELVPGQHCWIKRQMQMPKFYFTHVSVFLYSLFSECSTDAPWLVVGLPPDKATIHRKCIESSSPTEHHSSVTVPMESCVFSLVIS